MHSLSGKVALVTGAAGERGIGRAIATRLAEEGADVAVSDIVALPHGKGETGWGGLPQVVREIEALGRRCTGILADVTCADQVEHMVRQTVADLGRIDVFVSNAASRPGRDRVLVVDLDEDAWDTVQRVNVKGTFLSCRAVARVMIDQGEGGKIITMSSVSGKRGFPRFAAYCASKFAVVGFTQVLALELAPHGITVNAICPGTVDTERQFHISTALASPEMSADECHAQRVAEACAVIPLGRVAQARDVAGVAAFLASPDSDYLTGQSISVTGGTHMG